LAHSNGDEEEEEEEEAIGTVVVRATVLESAIGVVEDDPETEVEVDGSVLLLPVFILLQHNPLL
jgi:hypothetical protein